MTSGDRAASSSVPDRRQHHARHPVLKRLGFRLVGAHDELVEARLADELVRPTYSLEPVFTNIGLTNVSESVRCADDPEHVKHVPRDEPRLPAAIHDANLTAVEVEQADVLIGVG